MPSGDTVGLIYHDELQKKLLRHYEINERFNTAFNEAAAWYGSGKSGQTVHIPPRIPNLGAEARLREPAAPEPVGDVIPEENAPAPVQPLAAFGDFRPGRSGPAKR
jgi:hypothetical protein